MVKQNKEKIIEMEARRRESAREAQRRFRKNNRERARELTERWRAENRKRSSYIAARSKARNFVLDYATLQELYDIREELQGRLERRDRENES